MRRRHTTFRTGILGATVLLLAAAPAQAQLFRDWADNEIDQVKNRVTTARDRAVEIVDKARDGFNKVTADMRDLVDESVDDLRRELDDQMEGRAEFLGPSGDCMPGSDCDRFRGDLIDLVTGVRDAGNTVFDVTPLDARVDLQNTIDLLETVPGRALYPLYAAMNRAGAVDSGLIGVIDDFSADLRILDETLNSEDGAIDAASSSLPASCRAVLDRSGAFENAVTGVAVASGALKMLGKGMLALGETGFDEKDAGVHGYVHVTLKNNRKKKFGSFFDGLADFGFAFSSYASNKLRYCTVLQTREDTLRELDAVTAILEGTDPSDEDQLDRILRNQMLILERIDAIGPPWGKGAGTGPSDETRRRGVRR